MEITVPVKDVTHQLLLTEFVSDGHCDGYEFSLCVGAVSHSPFITVNSRVYCVDIQDIVVAVVQEMIRQQE